MNVMNIVEECLLHFPSLKVADILIEIDRIHKEIANRSDVLTDVGELSAPSSNVSWSLPSNCKHVYGIELYNSSNFSVTLEDVDLDYIIEFGKINFISTNETTITGLGDGVSSAYINFVKSPATIDNESDLLELPEAVHFGVSAGVLKNFYTRIPVLPVTTQTGSMLVKDWNAVRHFDNEYEKAIREARKISNDTKDKTGRIVEIDELGNPVVIARQKRADLSGAVAVTPLMSLYSKYIRFTAVEGGAITINQQFGWTTEIAAPTIASNVVTVVSGSEFTETMFAETSKLVNYERVDANTWTFELYSGYSTMIFEIKEY